MYILEICEDPAILNLILFIKSLIEMISMVVPIILIVMVTIDLVKIMMGNSDKALKSATKSMLNRIIAAVIVFFVPTIVNIVLVNVEEDRVEKSACWTNATEAKIEYYSQIYEANKASEKQKKQEQILANNKKRDKEDQERKKKIVPREKSSGSASGNSLAEVAYNELGNSGTKYKNWYGMNSEWCAVFVSWAIAHTPTKGASSTACKNTSSSGSDKCVYTKDISIKSAVVYQFTEWIAKNKKFYHAKYYANKYGTYKNGSKVYEPVPGDLIFFNGSYSYTGNPKSCYAQLSHIGIVKEVKNGKVITVEGNTSGSNHYSTKVDSHSYDLGDSYVMGYGHWQG